MKTKIGTKLSLKKETLSHLSLKSAIRVGGASITDTTEMSRQNFSGDQCAGCLGQKPITAGAPVPGPDMFAKSQGRSPNDSR